MSKILQFPENRRVKHNLEKARDDLKDLYSSMDLCYKTIEKLEEKIKEEEDSYNKWFTLYVNATGFDNVEVEFMEYVSGDIQINVNTGEITVGEDLALKSMLDELLGTDEEDNE